MPSPLLLIGTLLAIGATAAAIAASDAAMAAIATALLATFSFLAYLERRDR